MKVLSRYLILFTLLFATVQCAKKEEVDYDQVAQKALDMWMAEHRPDVEKMPNGMYMEWLRPSEEGAAKPEFNEWILLNYRGYELLSGEVFCTRYEAEAKDVEQTYTKYTHYVPEYFKYTKSMVLTQAQQYALARMVKNDWVRLYVPLHLGYYNSVQTFSNGYEGWMNSTAKNPEGADTKSYKNELVVIEMTLEDIIPDPEAEELARVEEIAAAWDQTANKAVKVDEGLYYRVIEASPLNNDEGNFIGDRDEVYVTYVGRFLDGFLLKTNDNDVADAEWDYTLYISPLKYSADDSSDLGLNEKAVKEVVKTGDIKYDSQIELVFTSKWGKGVYGLSPSSVSPVVYPYTPLNFTVYFSEKDFDPDE